MDTARKKKKRAPVLAVRRIACSDFVHPLLLTCQIIHIGILGLMSHAGYLHWPVVRQRVIISRLTVCIIDGFVNSSLRSPQYRFLYRAPVGTFLFILFILVIWRPHPLPYSFGTLQKPSCSLACPSKMSTMDVCITNPGFELDCMHANLRAPGWF